MNLSDANHSEIAGGCSSQEAGVTVCGAGPAGIAAAIGAARSGADVLLLESQGCLGGVWTSGALTWIIDAKNKGGLMAEILRRIDDLDGRGYSTDGEPNTGFDAEKMKYLLETMCEEAGVRFQLHTRVCAALLDDRGSLTQIVTESKSGRQLWKADVFIDCTGDGDLGAQAGCFWEMGRPENGETQPGSFLALISGIEDAFATPFLGDNGTPWGTSQNALREVIERAGFSPSYSYPTMLRIRNGLYFLMLNHQYGVKCDDAASITKATVEGRREVHQVVDAVRSLRGGWENLRIVSTSSHVGLREGRRIRGLYQLSKEDLIMGRKHADGTCRVTFCVDVHATNPAKSKGLSNEGLEVQQYDIPLRAMIAADVDGLMMAGRCISGDFYAHASYRVTGNAVTMGEAAGAFAADAVRLGMTPHELMAVRHPELFEKDSIQQPTPVVLACP